MSFTDVRVQVPPRAPAQKFPLPLRFPPLAESSAGRGISSLSAEIRFAGFSAEERRGMRLFAARGATVRSADRPASGGVSLNMQEKPAVVFPAYTLFLAISRGAGFQVQTSLAAARRAVQSMRQHPNPRPHHAAGRRHAYPEVCTMPRPSFSLFHRARRILSFRITGAPAAPRAVGRGGRNGAERRPRRQAGAERAEFLPTKWGVQMDQLASSCNPTPPARASTISPRRGASGSCNSPLPLL